MTIKTSFCSIAFRKSPYNIFDIMTIISNIGYDAIELWGNHLTDIDIDHLREFMTDNDMTISMISPYMDFTDSLDEMKASLIRAEKFVETATKLSCRRIRVFTGIVGSAEATVAQTDQAVRGLKELCEIDASIDFALETHPKTLVDNVDSTIALIEKVGMDNLKVNLDIYHMWEVHQETLTVLDRLFQFTTHIHAKNANLPPELSANNHPLLHDKQAAQDIVDVTYLNKGQLEYDSFIEKLLDLGYDGYFSIEWFGHGVEQAARHELEFVESFTGSDQTLKQEISQR